MEYNARIPKGFAHLPESVPREKTKRQPLPLGLTNGCIMKTRQTHWGHDVPPWMCIAPDVNGVPIRHAAGTRGHLPRSAQEFARSVFSIRLHTPDTGQVTSSVHRGSGLRLHEVLWPGAIVGVSALQVASLVESYADSDNYTWEPRGI